MNKTKIAGMAALIYSVAATGAFAALKTWDGGGDGTNWSSASNWNLNTVPTAADDVVLDHTSVPGAYTVIHDSNVAMGHTCRTLTIGAAVGPTITFRIPATATVARSFDIPAVLPATPTNTFILEAGGRFENLAGPVAALIPTNILNNTTTKPNNRALFKNGGHYLHNSYASLTGAFPATGNGAATFEISSTLEIGPKLNAPQGTAPDVSHGLTFTNYVFGNLILNPTEEGDTIPWYVNPSGTSGTTGVVAGTMTVATGAFFISNASDSNTLALPMKIIYRGNIVNNGTMVFTGRGGNTNNRGGNFIDGSPSILGGTGIYRVSPLTVEQYASYPPGTLTINPGKSMVLDAPMTINGGATIDKNGAAFNGANSALQCSENPITGTGTLTAQSNASIRIQHPGGFDGQFAGLSALPTTAAGSNYRFGGTTAMITGANMPTVAGGVTFLNNAGITLSQPLTINAVAAFTSGTVTTSSVNTLTVGPASTPTRAKGYVVGDGYTQGIPGGFNGATRTLHVGTGTDYTPVSITLNGATATTGSLKVTPTATQHIDVTDPTKAIKRFWTLTAASLGTFNANMTFVYADADLTGLPGLQEFALRVERRNGGVWEVPTGSNNPATNTGTATGVTAFSDWTLEAVAVTAADPVWQTYMSRE